MSTELQTRPDSFITVAQWVDDLLTEWERAEAEGELPETIAVIARELEKATAREIQKVDSVAHARRVFKWAIEQAEAEVKRLKGRVEMFERRVERLDDAVIVASKLIGRTKWETPTSTIRVQKNGGFEPLDFTDVSAIPARFKRITVTLPLDQWQSIVQDFFIGAQITNRGHVEPDVEKIRKELKAGAVISGVRFGERGEHVRSE